MNHGATKHWQHLAIILRDILDLRIEAVEGCKKVCDFKFKLHSESPLFLPFVGYASEFDEFPAENVRPLWNIESLAKLDKEKEEKKERHKKWIFKAAEELLTYAERVTKNQ